MAGSERVTVGMWQVCPVCQGHRIVPRGFFAYPAGTPFTDTTTGPEKCLVCDGHGIVKRPNAVSAGGEDT